MRWFFIVLFIVQLYCIVRPQARYRTTGREPLILRTALDASFTRHAVAGTMHLHLATTEAMRLQMGPRGYEHIIRMAQGAGAGQRRGRGKAVHCWVCSTFNSGLPLGLPSSAVLCLERKSASLLCFPHSLGGTWNTGRAADSHLGARSFRHGCYVKTWEHGTAKYRCNTPHR